MNEEEKTQFQIELLLASLDAQCTHDVSNARNNYGHNTFLERHEQRARAAEQSRPTTDERETVYPNQPQMIIDVYVIEREAEEEPPTVVSTLAPQESQDDEESEALISPPQAPHTIRLRWGMIALVVLCVLMIGAAASVYCLPFLTPSASITIVTTAQQLTTTSSIQMVTNGIADPTKNQVAGRILPAITMSQARTVPTTGTTRQAAHGYVTFYNAAPYVQVVNAGTLLIGADGVQVVTDQNAIIPAAVMPTEGQVPVYTHALSAGRQGNIQVGDLYGQCCRLNVFVANSAFHGGQDARTYQSVTSQDIESVVRGMKTSVEQSVQAALQTQVPPTETLVTPLSCTANVTPDDNIGVEATQVTVTLNETCIGITYNTQAVTDLITTLATVDASKWLGTGYRTTGVHVTQVRTTKQGLDIISVSLWAYPFTQDQQNSIKGMIAGMSKDRATAILLHLTGVQSVSLTLKNSQAVPNNGQDIHLLFLQV